MVGGELISSPSRGRLLQSSLTGGKRTEKLSWPYAVSFSLCQTNKQSCYRSHFEARGSSACRSKEDLGISRSAAWPIYVGRRSPQRRSQLKLFDFHLD